MKRFLILIPLLAACAPAVSGNPINPSYALNTFRVRQIWKVNNQGKIENPDAVATAFVITKVDTEFGTIDATSVGEELPNNIYFIIAKEFGNINLIDYSVYRSLKDRYRICLMDRVDIHGNKYYGFGTFIKPGDEMISNSSKSFEYDYKTQHPHSTVFEGQKAYFSAIAPNGFGPCTLELVK